MRCTVVSAIGDFVSLDIEDFTLPHIVQLDSSGVQVVHPSSPGVQVFFFLVVVQPNYDTNFRWTPGELRIKFG